MPIQLNKSHCQLRATENIQYAIQQDLNLFMNWKKKKLEAVYKSDTGIMKYNEFIKYTVGCEYEKVGTVHSQLRSKWERSNNSVVLKLYKIYYLHGSIFSHHAKNNFYANSQERLAENTTT